MVFHLYGKALFFSLFLRLIPLHAWTNPSSRSSLRLSRPLFATEDEAVVQEFTDFKAPEKEIDRRRNFAIISHPDAGKTTLTEKLLLFGGAIQDAGAVKARADQRKATSDWMEVGL